MTSKEKVILITRRTHFAELVAQYNTEAQAEFVVNSRGDNFEEYRLEHHRYLESLQQVEAGLQGLARVQTLDREYLANFIFGQKDIIVVVGQDGLVANTLKYLNGHPVVAINPEPRRYDGVLLPFQVADSATVVNDVIHNRYESKTITMAKAKLNDGQELLAVNDFFIGPRLQTSARYEITFGDKSEAQSSSGIIVSTGLGSTGWMKSVLAGAQGVVGKAQDTHLSMEWDSDYLQFAVREPFPSQTTGVEIVFGKVDNQRPLTVASRMPSNGVIFSDGMVEDIVEFNSGASVQIACSARKGILVV